jgi:hypothetical protein
MGYIPLHARNSLLQPVGEWPGGVVLRSSRPPYPETNVPFKRLELDGPWGPQYHSKLSGPLITGTYR